MKLIAYALIGLLFVVVVKPGLSETNDNGTDDAQISEAGEESYPSYPMSLKFKVANFSVNATIISKEEFSKYLIVASKDDRREVWNWETTSNKFNFTMSGYGDSIRIQAHAVVKEKDFQPDNVQFQDLTELHPSKRNVTYIGLKCPGGKYVVLQVDLTKIALVVKEWVNKPETKCPRITIAMLHEAYTSPSYPLIATNVKPMKNVKLMVLPDYKRVKISFESNDTVAYVQVENLESLHKMTRLEFSEKEFNVENFTDRDGSTNKPHLLKITMWRGNIKDDSIRKISSPNKFFLSIIPKSNVTYRSNYGHEIEKQIARASEPYTVIFSYRLTGIDVGDYEFYHPKIIKVGKDVEIF